MPWPSPWRLLAPLCCVLVSLCVFEFKFRAVASEARIVYFFQVYISRMWSRACGVGSGRSRGPLAAGGPSLVSCGQTVRVAVAREA
eukprot:scaffold9928_cov112-Isochrysis_galbana.AAC.10